MGKHERPSGKATTMSSPGAGPARPLGIAAAQLRILGLRFSRSDLASLGPRHLVYGLLVTWAAGLGRYWDHPDPYLLQALGLGSLAVMVALAAFLYAILLPLRLERWSFVHLLTFLSLTALPALLYAIPVERFLPLDQARTWNVAFLALVALWRIAMLERYLAAWTGLPGLLRFAVLLLPLALIVAALTLLNLEKALFDVMAGLREEGTGNDAAYQVLFVISAFSYLASPVLVAFYGFAVWQRRSRV